MDYEIEIPTFSDNQNSDTPATTINVFDDSVNVFCGEIGLSYKKADFLAMMKFIAKNES